MDGGDGLGPGQDQEVVVAGQFPGVLGEAVAAVVGFLQPEGLDLRAHGAVQDQDAAIQVRREVGTIGHGLDHAPFGGSM